MSRLLPTLLLVLLLALSLLDPTRADADSDGPGGDEIGGLDDRHTRSHRVDITQLPGMTFTAEQLAREEHWTGMLPVNSQPHHSKDHSDSSDSSAHDGDSQLFYWLIKSRHHIDRRTAASSSSDRSSDSDNDSNNDNNDDDAGGESDSPPLVIWINGGPGCSSLGGLLEEHGPFFLERNPDTHSARHDNPHPYRLVHNRYSWSNYADVMYIDQPVGVGFSHLHSKHDLVHTEGRVAQDFYRALTYFLTHHQPQYRHRRIYLSGESYAAKYIPAIAGYVLNQNHCLNKHRPALDDAEWSHYNNTFHSLGLPTSCPHDHSASAPSMYMHLDGLLIGNGDYSPLLQRFASRPLTLSLGLMDVKQANQYSFLEEMCMKDLRKAVIRDNDTDLYMAAFDSCGNLESAVTAFTAGINFEDMRNYKETFSTKLWLAFINHHDTRRTLHIPDHVPQLKADCSQVVADALQVDAMKDIRGLFSFLLNRLRVTVYTGNFDLLDGSWSNEVFLDSLWHWKERRKWFLSRRHVWRPLPCSIHGSDNSSSSSGSSDLPSVCPPITSAKADEVYGYSKSYDHLSFVVVAQAGHMVATTQPDRAHELLYRFIHNLPYYNPEQRDMNDADAQEICAVLQCDRAGHGLCDKISTDCVCQFGWTGTACTIPVWRITDRLFQSSLLTAGTTLSTYTHSSRLSSQATDMYYFAIDDATLSGLNKAQHRRSPHDPHYIEVTKGRQPDRLSSAGAATCTFEPPLLLKVVVREVGRSPAAPFHLSTSVFWNSYFQNADSSSAIRFFGDFDPSNLFLGRNLHGDRQSLGPRVLSMLTSPSSEHVSVVGLTQCDHYAIKVGNSEGAIDDIEYVLHVSIHEAGVGEGQQGLLGGSAAAASGVSEAGGGGQSWVGLVVGGVLPWCLFGVAAVVCCWLLVLYQRLVMKFASVDEQTPLLVASLR